MIEMHVSLPVLSSNESIFVAVEDSEQFLSLLLSDIDGDMFASIPKIIEVQHLWFFACQLANSIVACDWIIVSISDPFSYDF